MNMTTFHLELRDRAAGANSTDQDIRFKGAYKTAIVKTFDYTMARTGMNAFALNKLNIPFKTVFTITGSTPSYYPRQTDLIIEIFYDEKTKTILWENWY